MLLGILQDTHKRWLAMVYFGKTPSGRRFLELLLRRYEGQFHPRFFGIMRFGMDRPRVSQDDEETVKECYKEYIGMVKIYYEEAQRSKQDEGPKGEVVGNSSGTAHVKDPLGYAGMSVEIGSALEGTPKKTAQFGVKMESNMEDTADEDEQGSTSSSDDFIVIT
ncbi:hypothetical protein Tco_1227164 [Tanacetum coccineum]